MVKNTDKLWNKEYNKVMVANFAMYFSFYLITPLLPLYLHEHFGASKDVIGMLLSGYALAALISRPFSGYIVDSFSRKKVLVFFLFIYFVLFGGYLTAGSLTLFAVIRTLHGAPFGAATVSASTVAIDTVPSSRRNEGIGYYGLSNNIATAVAPTAGVLIYKYYGNFEILFILALFFAAIGLVIASFINIPCREIVKNKNKLSLDRFFLTKGWLLGVNMIFFSLCYGVISNYVAIYGKQVLGITGGTGLFFTLFAVGLILSRLQGGKALRQGKMVHNAKEGILISTLGYIIFILMKNEYGFYAAPFLIGIGNGHMYPAFQNMIIGVAYHNERGTANSTLLTCWDVGVGIGIVTGGVLSEYFSYSTAFWTIVGVHIAGVILFFTCTGKFFVKRRIAE